MLYSDRPASFSSPLYALIRVRPSLRIADSFQIGKCDKKCAIQAAAHSLCRTALEGSDTEQKKRGAARPSTLFQDPGTLFSAVDSSLQPGAGSKFRGLRRWNLDRCPGLRITP